MYTTTLRLSDELARYLQETAQGASMSVNAFLSQLLEKERAEARRQRLTRDWAEYAADGTGQDVEYALPAQGELVAEPPVQPYRAEGGAARAPTRKPRARGKR